MKKIRSIFSKVMSSITVSAIALSFAASAVGAVSTTVLHDYTASLDQDRSFIPLSWMEGYFETGNSSHNGRAGTHFNPGSLDGKAFTKLYYNTATENNKLVNYDGANTSKNFWGWIESSWVEAPSNYTSCSKIYFYGYKYNDYGNVISIYRIDVNG